MTIHTVHMGDLRVAFDPAIEAKFKISSPLGTFNASGPFVSSFLRMIDVPIDSLNTNNPFTSVFNSYAKRTLGRLVKLYERNGYIIAIIPEECTIIGHKAFDKIGNVLKRRYKIVDLFPMFGNTNVLLFDTATFRPFNTDGDEDELMQCGLFIEFPHNGNHTIVLNRALRRTISGAVVIVAEHKHAIKLSVDGLTVKRAAHEFVDCIHFTMQNENNDFISYVSERCSRMRDVRASLRELITTSNKVANLTDDSLDDELEVDYALDLYGLISPSDKSVKWLATAKTTQSRWEVFDIASRATLRCDRPKDYELAKYSGKLITTSGDLEDLAPELGV